MAGAFKTELKMKLPSLPLPFVARIDIRAVLTDFFALYLKTEMTVYDIGCGSKPFQGVLNGCVAKYIGVDLEDGFYDSSHIDLVGSAYNVPIPDGTADAVISCQVIEHLERPFDAFREAGRILKEDGIFLLSFPFLYPMHAAPRDYFRYTEFAVAGILEENGFEILEKRRIGGFWYCAGLFFGMYLKTFNRGIINKLNLVKILTFFVQWPLYLIHTLEGLFFDIAKKDKSAMRSLWTVNYVIAARKKTSP
ncbi:MAG: methyltransferase domain-containing protein [Micavibrio sp.]